MTCQWLWIGQNWTRCRIPIWQPSSLRKNGTRTASTTFASLYPVNTRRKSPVCSSRSRHSKPINHPPRRKSLQQNKPKITRSVLMSLRSLQRRGAWNCVPRLGDGAIPHQTISGGARIFWLPRHSQGTRIYTGAPSKIMRSFLISSRSLLLHCKNEW